MRRRLDRRRSGDAVGRFTQRLAARFRRGAASGRSQPVGRFARQGFAR